MYFSRLFHEIKSGSKTTLIKLERSKFVNCIDKLCQDIKDDPDLAKQLIKLMGSLRLRQ